MSRWITIALVVLLAIGGGWLFLKEDQAQQGPGALETRIVIGGDGKELTIPAHPKRVIVISSSGLDMYLAVGGEETLVGATTQAEMTTLTKEQLEFVKTKENVGVASGVNLEKVIALKPDLVIGTEIPFQRQLETPLKQAGIPLFLISTSSIDDNIKTVRLFGELTGKAELAQKEVKEVEDAIAEAKKRKGDRPAVKVLPVFGTPESFMVALPSSFPGNILDLAGGDNIGKALKPAGTGMGGMTYAPFSLEYAIEMKPEYILFISHGDPELVKKHLAENFATNEAWRSLPAVRENRIEVLPYELFAINPGAKSDQAITFLSKLLYPEEK